VVTIKLALCVVFSIYANITDWKRCKIENRASVSFFVLGLVVQVIFGRVDGLLSGLGGVAVMLVTFPFFALRMIGAGDVKALMAIGAMVGWPAAGTILINTVLGSGAIAIVIMITRKNGKKRFRYVWEYLKLCFFTRSIQPYTQKLEAGEATFRFSFGITIGVLISLIQSML